MNAFISYEGLPVNSGGAHSLAKKSFIQIYADTKRFLQTFGNTDKAKKIDFTFYSSRNGSYKTLPILWRLTKTFGIPSYHQWDMVSFKQHFYSWKLSSDKAEKGLELLQEYIDLPPNEYGPVVLSFIWHFQFINPHDKQVLRGQSDIPVLDKRQQNSQLHLRLGKKSTISAWLAFPFVELDETALKYLGAVKELLPFKPSEKHWRLWRKSAKGNWTPRAINL